MSCLTGQIPQKLRALGAKGYISLATIECTTRCNLSCNYCYVLSDSHELTSSELRNAIDQLADAGVLAISLTGGEVFLRNDIMDIIDHIFTRGFFQLFILTNGTLITEEHIRFLAANSSRLGYIRFSLFSHQASVHDAFTGVPGSFERTLANLTAMKKQDIPVYILLNAIEENVDTLSESNAYFTDLGFSVQEGYVKFITDEPTRKACSPLVSRPFFKRLFAQTPETKMDGLRKTLTQRCFSGQVFSDLMCEKMFSTVAILADGSIVPCISFRKESLGNIVTNKVPLQKLFQESSLIKKLRSLSRQKITPCNTCKFLNYCVLCPGMIYEEFGSYNHPSEQSCNFVKALHESLAEQQ